MSVFEMFEWYSKLESEVPSFEVAESLGRPSVGKTEENMIQIIVYTLVNRYTTVLDELTDELGITF
jgi:hypothetical protein